MEALRRRAIGVDFLRIGSAVLVTLPLVSTLAIASTVAFADLFLFLAGILASVAMLIPWIRRKTIASVARTLDAPERKEQAAPGQLSRLLRTYWYYRNNPGPRPDLFDYTRRQLAVRILGIDLRSHLPLSPRMIASSAAKLSFVLVLFALIVWLMAPPDEGARMVIGKQNPHATDTQYTQNKAADEIVANIEALTMGRGQVTLLRLIDAFDRTFEPDQSQVKLKDRETGAERVVTLDETNRKHYETAFQRHRSTLIAFCTARGAVYLELDTNDLWYETLLENTLFQGVTTRTGV